MKQSSSKFKIFRILLGIIAAIVWYVCYSKGGNPVVQEIAGVLAVVCLFGKLLWRMFTRPSRSNAKSSLDNGSTTKQYDDATTIRPYFLDLKRTWVWNGKELRPYYRDLNKTWIWDGKELRPYYYDLHKTWIWDGKELRPYYHDLNKTWIWDGKELRPYYYDLHKTWVWKDDQMQPYFRDLNKTWVVEGDVSVPVLAKAIGII